MFTRHVHRRRLSTWLVGLLLLAQWLVAAHACLPLPAMPAAASPASVAQGMAPHCHDAGAAGATAGAVSDAAALCKAHCSVDEQAATAAAPGELSQPAAGWTLVSAALPLLPADTAAARAAPVRDGAPPGWPPLYLLHGVLRN